MWQMIGKAVKQAAGAMKSQKKGGGGGGAKQAAPTGGMKARQNMLKLPGGGVPNTLSASRRDPDQDDGQRLRQNQTTDSNQNPFQWR